MEILSGVDIHINQVSKTLFKAQVELANFYKAHPGWSGASSELLDVVSKISSICCENVYFYERNK